MVSLPGLRVVTMASYDGALHSAIVAAFGGERSRQSSSFGMKGGAFFPAASFEIVQRAMVRRVRVSAPVVSPEAAFAATARLR